MQWSGLLSWRLSSRTRKKSCFVRKCSLCYDIVAAGLSQSVEFDFGIMKIIIRLHRSVSNSGSRGLSLLCSSQQRTPPDHPTHHTPPLSLQSLFHEIFLVCIGRRGRQLDTLGFSRETYFLMIYPPPSMMSA